MKAVLGSLTAVSVLGTTAFVSPVLAETDTQTIPNNNVITSTDTSKATAESLNANVTGKDNTVTNSKEAVIVGDKNVVTDETGTVASDYSRIIGSNNTVKGSKGQLVFGDDNEIIGRDKGTTSPTRPDNQVDITIGRGNILQGAETWRPNKDSRLTVIGNNNRGVYELGSAAGIISGIVIGDNQNIDEIDQSIVIGSLSAEEQKATYGEGGEHEEVNTVGKYSTIIGYHSTNVGGGNIIVGNRSRVGGGFNIITGHRSTIGNPYEGNTNFLVMGVKGGEFSNIYGSFNRIDDKGGSETIDGIASTIQGSMNVTTRATGAMLIGTGNTITNSFFKFDDAMGNKLFGATYGSVYYIENKNTLAAGNNLEIYYDDVRSYINDYMVEGSGAVSIVGNSNKADYAIRSQIIGNANAVTGTETAISSLNTVSGFGNKAESISRSSIIGTGNELKGGENNVIIGDYHKLKDGKRNVILGSMETKEEIIEKVAKSALPSPIGKDAKYTIKEYNPLIDHTKDIEEAVMLGYNTDVSQNGGVALGANSIASTKAGIAGYDPVTAKASTATGNEWKSTWAAVSVGDGTNTRQITGVAAGFADTDAVNVAQLKSVLDMPIKIYSGGSQEKGSYVEGGKTYEMKLSNLKFDFGDGIKAEEVGTDGDKKIFVSLDKDYISTNDTLRGPKGEDGANGKSAYDIWKNSDTKNIDKTEKDFLDSLKGEPGKDGTNGTNGADGKSAYDVWKENGNEGKTEKEFIDSLKGEPGKDGANGTNGADGKSAYDVWKENGHPNGTIEEYEKAIKGEKGDPGEPGQDGENGKDGKSAYEVWKENGNPDGTIEEYEKAIKGEKGDPGEPGTNGINGQDGKSAYDIWKNSDTKNANKTEKDFLDSLKGKDGKDGKDGGVGTVKAGTNITVTKSEKSTTQAPQYEVSLNNEITLNKVTTGNATQSVNGFIVKDGPSMTVTGIDAGGKKITNVAAGTAKSDAVNYGQLQVVEETANRNTEAIRGIGGQMNRLSNRINDAGASAAALAALHPLEYDPTDKWNFAVGYGNYKNANSVALGAFYRASDNFMVSVGGSFGNDEKMVNAGLSFRFGQGGSGLSRPAMAKKMASLEDTVKEQKETINSLKNTIEEQNKKMAALEELIKQQGELITKVAK